MMRKLQKTSNLDRKCERCNVSYQVAEIAINLLRDKVPLCWPCLVRVAKVSWEAPDPFSPGIPSDDLHP